MPLITLLTDFGICEPYVGVMKGILLSSPSRPQVVDLTHDLPRHDIETASFWLSRVVPYFPSTTIHVAVVDPGVGTSRRGVCIKVGHQLFVGPDNGIFSDVLKRSEPSDFEGVSLDAQRFVEGALAVGATFHGRDLFAPAARVLSEGSDLSSLGPRVDSSSLVRLDLDRPPNHTKVRVVDHFGNLITDTPVPENVAGKITVAGRTIPWVRTYGEASRGTLVALPGSWGTVEIAVTEGSAAERTGWKTGDLLELSP